MRYKILINEEKKCYEGRRKKYFTENIADVAEKNILLYYFTLSCVFGFNDDI